MSKLTIHENERSTVYEILEDSLVIGGKQGCGIRVSDPAASAEHCQVTLVPGMGYKLIDLESREGTKINGAFVNQHLLREGDVIQIGNVRISYAGEAPAAPPPGPARAPVAGVPIDAAPVAPARAVPAAARPVQPARPAARPQFDGYSSAPPREYRPPRRGRGDSSGPIIMMAVAVGLLLIVVIVVVIVGSGAATGNEKIYLDMEKLIAAGQYDAALSLAEQADKNGDPKYLAKIEFQKQAVRTKRAKKGGMNREYNALKAYQEVESWIQQHRHDIAGTITKWEGVIREYPGTLWATKARTNIDHLLSGGKNPEGITKYPGGRSTIDRSFTVAQATAKSFEDEDRFQEAIDAFFDFWEENKLRTTDIATWEGRVQDEVKGIESRAESRWQTLDGVAKKYVENGQYAAAIRMYRKVAERFGIEKYQYRAGEAIRKIQKD